MQEHFALPPADGEMRRITAMVVGPGGAGKALSPVFGGIGDRHDNAGVRPVCLHHDGDAVRVLIRICDCLMAGYRTAYPSRQRITKRQQCHHGQHGQCGAPQAAHYPR